MKQEKDEYLYKDIEDYESVVGYKVNETFKIAWTMARAKKSWFKKFQEKSNERSI